MHLEIPIDKCEFCNNKAEMLVYDRTFLYGENVTFVCKRCLNIKKDRKLSSRRFSEW